MSWHDIVFLGAIVGAFALFGGVLGFASWEETRTRRRRSN
jgi:hypothetical protein